MSDAPRPSSLDAQRRMERQPRTDTQPEIALRRELHGRGLRYRLQQRLLPETRRTADIVFPRPRVVVEVRGCFWHGCPEHSTVPKANREWWADKIETNRRRDADTDSRLREAGWTVVVVWEHEDVVEAAERIETMVVNRKDRDAPGSGEGAEGLEERDAWQ